MIGKLTNKKKLKTLYLALNYVGHTTASAKNKKSNAVCGLMVIIFYSLNY